MSYEKYYRLSTKWLRRITYYITTFSLIFATFLHGYLMYSGRISFIIFIFFIVSVSNLFRLSRIQDKKEEGEITDEEQERDEYGILITISIILLIINLIYGLLLPDYIPIPESYQWII